MSDPAMQRVWAAAVLCCGPHCPHGVIGSRLREQDVLVVEIPELEEGLRSDVDFLATRILDAAAAVPAGIPIGVVGGNVAGAAALIAAAQSPRLVTAVVSVNGRTDLAIDSIPALRMPVLLVVNDMPVLRMNREALPLLKGERRLEIVHGTDEETAGVIVEKTTRWLTDRLFAGAEAV